MYHVLLKIDYLKNNKKGDKMIEFEKEVKQFKPILNIEHIEEQIVNDEIKDINDYIREIARAYNHNSNDVERR